MKAEKKLRARLQTEVDTGFLYRRVASMEKDSEISSIYLEMARLEGVHKSKMMEKVLAIDSNAREPGPSVRARIISKLGGLFGQNMILGILLESEKSISSASVTKKNAGGIQPNGAEDRHVRILKSLDHLSGDRVRKMEGSHRNVGGNALRAAVLGADDGLVSNLSLVMGVAGATHGGNAVLIAGFAGLLAGAFSMALGEWISVKSSQELFERQVEIEMEEIENNPEEEKQEIILMNRAKGMPEDEALALAERIFSDKDNLQTLLVREELGLNPDELKGSAWEASITSFLLFVTGAIIPLAPFIFLRGQTAIITSVIVSTIALFSIGASITLLTGKPLLKSGMRQVIIGLAAAAVTFSLGKLIGAALP
jgi:VIT1/CCC1 family predicted Fe2+/Mn2+ transporter